MTEMLQKEFSRMQFVKGGGALVVGFSMFGVGAAVKASAADGPYASNGPPDAYQVDSWIVIHADNSATIKSGAIQQGTGSDTAILMIAAEELGMDMRQLRFVDDDTNVTPDTGNKTASNTVAGGAGRGTRAAAAAAAQTLLGLASVQLAVPVSQLSVMNGVVSGGGRSVTYGQLLGGKLFNATMPAGWDMQNARGFSFTSGLLPGQAPAKPVSQYKVVGTRPPRIEIPAIAAGTLTYIQNIRLPGMLHGRVVRPRGQAVYGAGAPIVSVDASSIKKISGARIVRIKDFLGVVAPTEFGAIQAAAQLKVKWAEPPAVLPGGGNEFQALRELDSAGKTIQGYRLNTGNVDSALPTAAHVVAASYGWPSNVHTPIGASCAVADVTPNGVRVFAGTQGAYGTRAAVARALGLPVNNVRVTAVAMGGAFGPGMPYNDTAQAAALMSRAVGAPVRLQLMRWDELGWTSTSPGTLMDVRAGVDAKGKLVGFDFTQFYPHYVSGNVLASEELAGTPLTQPSSPGGVSAPPTAMYDVPNNRWLLKAIPNKDNAVRSAWMRTGSTPQVTWAVEQTIDELARASNMDPAAFRRQNVVQDASGANTKQRLLSVLDSVTRAANWQPKVPGSTLSDATVVRGRGLAWSDVAAWIGQPAAAAIADVEVNKKTGKVTITHIYQAYAGGLAVNPALVENQVVGGVNQILSRLLTEQLRFSKTRVTSGDFVTYPLLRFKDAPKITPIIVQEAELPPTGVGEQVTQVAAAAVANAFFDATGVRMRTAPMTPARVRATLAAKGAGTAGVR
jgi:CO/xanthine dehydrogenase Mo-binding subunit